MIAITKTAGSPDPFMQMFTTNILSYFDCSKGLKIQASKAIAHIESRRAKQRFIGPIFNVCFYCFYQEVSQPVSRRSYSVSRMHIADGKATPWLCHASGVTRHASQLTCCYVKALACELCLSQFDKRHMSPAAGVERLIGLSKRDECWGRTKMLFF